MPEHAESPDPFHLCGVTIDGKYRIASVIGDGGFGVVYRGVHKGFGELIAVKCLKVSGVLAEAERDALLEQLRDEGRLLHRLSKLTSGIVQALDVGAFTTEAGTWVPYLVLEWLEGETLALFLKARSEAKSGPMPLAEAVKLLEPAARALGIAHAQNVAHRDVKPANLFVTSASGTRTLKVLDFGIAKVLSEHASFTAALEATKLGPTAFTPRYGAPEQFNKNRGATGPWTDVFALALILVELVTGKKALEGDDPTQLYIASADPALRPTLRARGSDCPDVIEHVVDKALSVEPKLRYANASDFWDALVAAIGRASAPPPGKTAKTAISVPRGAIVATPAPTDIYLAQQKISISDSGERSTPALDATRPIESLRGEVIAVPAARTSDPDPSTKIVSREPETIAVIESSSAEPKKSSRPRSLRDDDPMAETPTPDDAKRPSAKPKALAESKPRAVSAEPASSPPPSRGLFPYLAAIVVLAGGAAAWVALGDPGKPQAHKPAASSSASAHPHPSSSAPRAASSIPTSPSALAVADQIAAPFQAPADMAFIAPGTFSMGNGDAARQVTLTRGFYLDRTEVTVRAYAECMDKRVCSSADHISLAPDVASDAGAVIPSPPDKSAEIWNQRCNQSRGAPSDPINCVDYQSAEAFCRFRGRRLPTEAEWELAARGTAGRPFVWGNDAPDCSFACYDRNGGCVARDAVVTTCASASHTRDRTPEGVSDLAGNVSEWVADGFASPLQGGTDPKGDATSALKVVRGASFRDEAEKLGAAARAGASPTTADVAIGFRCALDAPGDAGAP